MKLLRLTTDFDSFSEKNLWLWSWISLTRWHLFPVVECRVNNFLVLRFKLIDILFVVGYFWLELLNVCIEEIFLLRSHTVLFEKIIELAINTVVSVLIGSLSSRILCWGVCVLCGFVLTVRSCKLIVRWIFGKVFKQIFHIVFLIEVFGTLLLGLFKFWYKFWKGFCLAFF